MGDKDTDFGGREQDADHSHDGPGHDSHDQEFHDQEQEVTQNGTEMEQQRTEDKTFENGDLNDRIKYYETEAQRYREEAIDTSKVLLAETAVNAMLGELGYIDLFFNGTRLLMQGDKCDVANFYDTIAANMRMGMCENEAILQACREFHWFDR